MQDVTPNELLKEEQGHIVDLTYLKDENLGSTGLDRKAIFDLYCENEYRYDIKLQDIVTNKIFYDKLTFIYLEMPKFKKTLSELETRFEKWLFAIKNLDRLERVPDAFREQVFERFFEVAEIANFSREVDKPQKYHTEGPSP